VRWVSAFRTGSREAGERGSRTPVIPLGKRWSRGMNLSDRRSFPSTSRVRGRRAGGRRGGDAPPSGRAKGCRESAGASLRDRRGRGGGWWCRARCLGFGETSTASPPSAMPRRFRRDAPADLRRRFGGHGRRGVSEAARSVRMDHPIAVEDAVSMDVAGSRPSGRRSPQRRRPAVWAGEGLSQLGWGVSTGPAGTWRRTRFHAFLSTPAGGAVRVDRGAGRALKRRHLSATADILALSGGGHFVTRGRRNLAALEYGGRRLMDPNPIPEIVLIAAAASCGLDLVSP
jgi:hypothetical protein